MTNIAMVGCNMIDSRCLAKSPGAHILCKRCQVYCLCLEDNTPEGAYLLKTEAVLAYK